MYAELSTAIIRACMTKFSFIDTEVELIVRNDKFCAKLD